MKKLLLVIAVITAVSIPAAAGSYYTSYRNESFGYTITVPSSWNLYDINTEKRHILYVYPNNSVMIKIKALKSDTHSAEDVLHNKNWNLLKIDSRLNRIIETENIQINKNIEGKLLVFEYKKGRNTVLQRVLVTRNEESVFLIECKAPVYSFYKYDEIFNNALASFSCDGKASASEKTDESDKIKAPVKSDATVKKDDKKTGKEESDKIEEDVEDSEW